MLQTLKRHEVQILLRANYPRTEVARLSGVSLCSVARIAREAPVVLFDDAAERAKRRIGRPSVVEEFRKTIGDILKEKADARSLEVLRQVREAGYKGGKTALYALVASLRPMAPGAKRNESFEWMRPVQQGAISRSALKEEFGHVTDLDKLLRCIHKGPLSQRKKAMAILFLERGIGRSLVCSFLHLSRDSACRYWERHRNGSMAALFAKKVNVQRKSQDERIRQAVFAMLHSPPSAYGLNRTSWKMADLQRILREQGQSLSRDLISTIIGEAGFKWRKARVVLTSRDPNYLAKVETIVKILSELKSNEAFFSIDEFGPFAVKKRGGGKWVAPEESYTVSR
jgi:transposase